MTLKVIAYARNGHTDKFGIPRQSREESPIITRIVFEPEFAVQEALRGIEGFSHLWILWGFDKVESRASRVKSQDWSPTVRPPRLGGNKRMGVFATRSPYRPNPIGLSSVRLLKVESRKTKDERHILELLVSGADMMDGTPIYDIKPYLSFSDSHPEAKNGFAEEHKDDQLKVDWNSTTRVESEMSPRWDRDWIDEVSYILSQDPRPAYQDDPEREYKMDYAGWRVTFTVDNGTVFVRNVEKA